jgi:hypothetical protein
MMVAYIKEQVSKRLITIEKIPTKLNPAEDILSKPTYGSDGSRRLNENCWRKRKRKRKRKK